MKNLMISCGGTGGHFNPGLAAAREFKERGGNVLLLLGGKNAPGQAETASKFGIPSILFPAKPPVKKPIQFIQFLFDLFRGGRVCRKAMLDFKPEALLAMGSFASLAPVRTAKKLNVPFFLHDGNARVGHANRYLSRSARAMALSFPAVNVDAVSCPTILTGLPLRPEIIRSPMSKAEAVAEINRRTGGSDLTADKPIVLIFGGSLGANTLNRKLVLEEKYPGSENWQFIRIVGKKAYDELKDYYKNKPGKTLVLSYFEQMNILYSAADFVVSRSGGSSVSELAVFGKYALLVPYPYAAEDHQNDNARWLAGAGGAEIIQDRDCSPLFFAKWLVKCHENMDEIIRKGLKSRQIAFPNASANVIDMIANITDSNGKK